MSEQEPPKRLLAKVTGKPDTQFAGRRVGLYVTEELYEDFLVALAAHGGGGIDALMQKSLAENQIAIIPLDTQENDK